MESIGQKAVLPTTDEVIVAGELDVDSGESGEERMFDAALEEIIAEHPLDESSLGESLEEDVLNASMASAIFAQNQVDPEVVKVFDEIDFASMPSEIMKDNLWGEDSLSVQSQVLKKATAVEQEMIEVLDPRVITEESNFQNLPVKGVAETGLQSFLQGTAQENQETLLQTVFHRVKPTEVDSDFSGDDLQSVLQKSTSLSVEIEGDAEFSTDDLQTVLQKNTGQPVHVQERNSVAQDLKSIQESQEGPPPQEPQSIFPQGLQDNAQETEKPVEENLAKIELEKVLRAEEKLKAKESFQVADKIKMAEALESKAAEIAGGVKIKTPDVSQAIDKFKVAEGIEGGVKAGFQMTGVENSRDISEKVFTQPFNQFRNLASKETQLSSNAKSTVDLVSPQGINAVSDLSGTSTIKSGEAASTVTETVRGADLPFEMDQVVNRVRILRGNGVEEMTLRLHPEELGQITLKVRQSGGGLTIDMRVDNPLAKQMVESGFDSLRSRFLDQEFSYQDLALNVDINERDSQYGGGREHFEFEEEMFSSEKGKKEEISSLEETPHVGHRTDSGLNLYV